MLRTVTILLLLLLSISIYPQSDNQEFRATWVITWEFISGNSTVEQNKAKIRKILDDHKAANMNAVLWHVRQGGTAYYQSSYEPWGSYAGGQYPGFDPLQYAIEEAHKRGMELHAWFNVFAAGSTAAGAPAQKYPGWICRDADGNPMTSNIALSPGMDSVRNYTLNVAMEVVRNYDIDGIHLDYIRWNEYAASENSDKFAQYQEEHKLMDGEITPEQVDELNNNQAGRYLYDHQHPANGGVPVGYTSWEDWWRASVTDYVKRLHDSVQIAKPWVRLSVAAIGAYNWGGWNGYNVVYQDAALWFNQGWVDQLTPMHYSWLTPSAFVGMLQGGSNSWAPYIQPGIAAGRLFTAGPGSYLLDENNVWNNHQPIVEQSRTVNFVDGFQFFSYGTWNNKNYFPTAGETFFSKKTKIRDSKTISSVTPPAPTIAMQKIDSLHYKIIVTPPAGINKNQWYIVYRSETNNFVQDTSEIVNIVFDDSVFVVDEIFNGNQNFNGQYKYAVTMADRYWNESNFSNQVITDAVPSYAPVVVSTTPEEGDTVHINSQVVFNFSKSLNPATLVPSSFVITPAKEIASIVASNNNKTVRLTFNSPLLFATNYAIKADTSLKDVNGKKIDGDGNGIPGDAFILNFSTIDADSTAPVLVNSTVNDSMDVDDVITLFFDEQLSDSSITANNFIIKKDGEVIIGHLSHVKRDGKSIVTLKHPPVLANNSSYLVTITGIKDVWNNVIPSDINLNFSTNGLKYSEKKSIDDFTVEANWQQPSFSGSTEGIFPHLSSFTWSSTNFVPSGGTKKSGVLTYAWDPSATKHFIREYLLEGTPRNITFDTSYTLQVYIFGDGSGTKFRFAIDETPSFTGHEVSHWTTIDWIGWKMVEWKLNDPASVGIWIGNGVLEPPFRMDSFQLIPADGSLVNGAINFDNLRAVKRAFVPVVVKEEELIPEEFTLYQNYPNPFNPSTEIRFALPLAGKVKLAVYNSIGQEVEVLVNNFVEAGMHTVNFNASNLTSGVYFYSITTNDGNLTKKMILLK